MKNKRVKGIWNQQKAKLKQESAQLSDNNLMFEEGREVERWMEIQQLLGKSKEELLRIIESN